LGFQRRCSMAVGLVQTRVTRVVGHDSDRDGSASRSES
jgi:hypothetical protein